MTPLASILLALLFVVAAVVAAAIVDVPGNSAMVVERRGRFHRVIGAGLHLVWPTREAARAWRFDDRTRITVRLSGAELVLADTRLACRDGREVTIAAELIWRFRDVARAAYAVDDTPRRLRKALLARLAQAAQEREAEELLTHEQEYVSRVAEALNEELAPDGLEVQKLSLSRLAPVKPLAK